MINRRMFVSGVKRDVVSVFDVVNKVCKVQKSNQCNNDRKEKSFEEVLKDEMEKNESGE